jgi:hypothetical protein
MEERQIYVFLPIWLEGGMIVARKRKMETALRKIQKIAEYYGMVYEFSLIQESVDCTHWKEPSKKYVPGRKSYEIRLRG